MSTFTAAAESHPNIAFIKYWGNADPSLRIPVNGSISMNLCELITRTRVSFDSDLKQDSLRLNNQNITGPALERVSQFLNIVRMRASIMTFAKVESTNNFPTGAGIASSAAAFSALALAAARATGLMLTEIELSALARRGSGSACRSVPGGFVEWLPGNDDRSSYAVSLASPDYWDLVDCIAIVADQEKKVGSTTGHALANSSLFQEARVSDTSRRLKVCRQAIIQRDFDLLAEIIEEDSTLMHAVMMTSHPSLFYWEPASLLIMKSVVQWRKENIPACFTLDAGPNVHVICPAEFSSIIEKKLNELQGVQLVLCSHPGGPAALVSE